MTDQQNTKRPVDMMAFYPRSGFGKSLWRAPLLFWRLGLGPITGKIFLVLTTRGRKSGLARHTMVEYHLVNGKKYSPCAFGVQSHWFRNIAVDPHVTIQTSDGTENAIAVRVTGDQELAAVFRVFMQRDPMLMKMYMQSLGMEPTVENITAHKEKINIFRFDPTDEAAPSGLDVDLAWLWPLALLVMAAAWMISLISSDDK